MPDLLVRSVPDRVVQFYRDRAKAHRRSMQQELLETLSRELDAAERRRRFVEETDRIREAIFRDRGGRLFTDSVELIREDRER